MDNKSISLKKFNIGFLLVFLCLFFFGEQKNTIELLLSVSTFGVILNLFFVRQPIIFFTLCYHALQATAKVFYAVINKTSINELATYSNNADLAEASRLSCIGLIFLSFAIYIVLPDIKPAEKRNNLNIKKLLFAYGGCIALGYVAMSMGQLGGLYQIVNKLIILKWGIFFLIVHVGIPQKKYYFIYIIIFEILISIISYFSTFKDVIFVMLISLLILNLGYLKIKPRVFILLASLSLFLGFTWQNIKEDYRLFLSAGEKSQTVKVGFDEAYDKIIDLVNENPYDAEQTLNKTVDRISYIDYFAESINYIPLIKPHTNGMVWLESLLHISQPRLLFPNKKVIDDSQKTMEFTGIMLADAEQGTSISLGYVAESYVDFGKYLFIIPIILLGLLIGWLFRKLFQSNINTIYCWALSIPFYFQFYGLEMASEKVLGSIITYAFIVFIIVKYGKKQLAWLEK